MATATTPQHCTGGGRGVGEYSFAHMRLSLMWKTAFLFLGAQKWVVSTQYADPNP